MTTIEKVKAAILRHPDWTDTRIAKNHNTTVSVVRSIRGHAVADPRKTDKPKPPASPPAEFHAKGVRLGENVRVLPRRPVESAAKFIRRLPNGRGFTLRELSVEWGRSEESIRRHAIDLGCLRYVEVEQDEWKQLVLSPETAAKYPA